MNMTFDPPPTADRARNKPHLTAHRLPSFTSSRQSQSQEPPAYTTDDILAYQHQKYSKLVSWLRIALSAIILVISVAIIACSGSSLRAYSGSTFAGDWWLPIWPLIVDLRPTHAVLACGIVLMVASLLYLAAALFPSVIKIHESNASVSFTNRSRSLILNFIFSTLSQPHSLYFACSPQFSRLLSQPPSIPTSPKTPPPPPSSHGPANGQVSGTRLPMISARYAHRARWPLIWSYC